MALHGHTADLRLHGYIQQHLVKGQGKGWIKARQDVLKAKARRPGAEPSSIDVFLCHIHQF